ncbi:hypothetical protein B0H11DRAFT_2069220, partial [Mycena galericulata]
MFSSSFILASLLLARATVSSPVPRDACTPTVIGSGITIASGDWEIGYASSVAGAPVISEALTATTAEFLVENTTLSNGGFLL